MQETKPLILLSNDDGIEAPGIHRLIDFLQDMAEIVVVAPASAQSGKSSAITVDTPLRLTEIERYNGAQMIKVNGTPVDCIKLGLHAVVERKPDLVVSGINHGSNSGNSVIYSGTMGATMEACMVGIPAIGFSLLHYSWDADFSNCREVVRDVVSKVLTTGLPDQICLNVNIPAGCTPLGIKVTEASRGHWTEEYAEYKDPSGRPFYLLTGRYIDDDPDNDRTDNYWLVRNYATIVPVRPDQTDCAAISTLKEILL